MATLPSAVRNHRGASSNPANRFQPRHSVFFIQSHQQQTDMDSAQSLPDVSWQEETLQCHPLTRVQEEQAKSIISKNDSPDVPFRQSINPYRGCEHGCIYCFARPTHAYIDLSPGLDFETRLSAKTNAAEILRETLAKPGYRCKPITLGANTDVYQPIEKDYRVTRQLLEVLQAHQHPFSIITKGHLITRDLDILSEMATKGLCSVMISMTTLNNELKCSLEPRAAAPATRLNVIRQLKEAGVPVGILLAPVIPHINDHEIEAILEASAKAGARSAAYVFLRLPNEVKPLFSEWLTLHYPRKASHVLSLIRQSRGGSLYNSRHHERMTGTGPIADMIAQRFQKKVRELGLNQENHFQLNGKLFQVPANDKAATVQAHPQLSLF